MKTHYFYKADRDDEIHEIGEEHARSIHKIHMIEDGRSPDVFVRGEHPLSGSWTDKIGQSLIAIRPTDALLGGFLSNTTATEFGTYADMLVPSLDEIAKTLPSALMTVLGRLLTHAFWVSSADYNEKQERAYFYASCRHIDKDNPEDWGDPPP